MLGGCFFHPLAWGLNYCYFIVIYDFLLCVCVFLIGGLVNFLKGILGLNGTSGSTKVEIGFTTIVFFSIKSLLYTV